MLGALMERKAQRGTNRACSGMVATVALPHTVQGLRRWSEHLDGVWDGDAKRCFPIDGAILTTGDAPKLFFKIPY